MPSTPMAACFTRFLSGNPAMALLARFRTQLIQWAIVGVLVWAVYALASQTIERLSMLGIQSGFGFLQDRAGFRIGEVLPLPVLNSNLLIWVVGILLVVVIHYVLVRRASMGAPDQTARRRFRPLLVMAILAFAGLAQNFVPLDFHRFSQDDNFTQAIVTGAANTLYVSAYALVFSTLFGLVVALMRLSKNIPTAALGGAFVELNRNMPLLLHLFFWYFAVVAALPSAKESFSLLGAVFINQRGIFFPDIVPTAGLGRYGVAILLTLGFAFAAKPLLAARRSNPSGFFQLALWLAPVAFGLSALALVYGLYGPAWQIKLPLQQGFNFKDAIRLSPEFVTLVIALSIYHGAYSAEIIRGGIQAIPRGQIEAGRAVGLGEVVIFWKIIIPQALRIIMPAMTNRYLNVIRSSSLGVAIGYEELVSVGHAIESATGQVIEMTAIVILFYVLLSVLILYTMNRPAGERHAA